MHPGLDRGGRVVELVEVAEREPLPAHAGILHTQPLRGIPAHRQPALADRRRADPPQVGEQGGRTAPAAGGFPGSEGRGDVCRLELGEGEVSERLVQLAAERAILHAGGGREARIGGREFLVADEPGPQRPGAAAVHAVEEPLPAGVCRQRDVHLQRLQPGGGGITAESKRAAVPGVAKVESAIAPAVEIGGQVAIASTPRTTHRGTPMQWPTETRRWQGRPSLASSIGLVEPRS